MQRFLLPIWCLLVVLACARNMSAKEWRGIVPLHSTRADVVRLFGACSQPDSSCKFQVGNEEVYIVFSSVESDMHECAKKLQPDTVLLVEVELTIPVRLDSLRINKKNFRTFDPSSPPNIGYKGFIDERAGLIIKTYKGKVLQLEYIGAGKDVHLCPSYYENPESFIQLLIHTCCAPLSVTCPTNEPVDGERLVFSANTVDVEHAKYKWAVSAGKIIQGQGTLRIVVDTTGAGGQTIVAIIEMTERKTNVATSSCKGIFVKPK